MTKEEYIDPSHVDDLVRAQGRCELLKAQQARLVATLQKLSDEVQKLKAQHGGLSLANKEARALLAELEVKS